MKVYYIGKMIGECDENDSKWSIEGIFDSKQLAFSKHGRR